jgi:crossover junction endodeoxyribonuclease RusA
MQIELPWISSKLHAHAKGHWREKSEATKAARTNIKFLAIDAINRKIISKMNGPVSVTYRFFVPDMRKRDSANMVQSCKPMIDGLVDAGVIEADDWTMLQTAGVLVELDRKKPRVVLEIRPV